MCMKKLDHTTIMQKLSFVGLSEYVLKWFKNDEVTPTHFIATWGVPQGSFREPLRLWQFCINGPKWQFPF